MPQVKEYSMQEIQNIGEVRLAMDRLAVRLAAIHGSQLDFLNLMELARKVEMAATQGDFLARINADIEFHLALSEISQNPSLLKIQRGLYLTIQYILIHHPNPDVDEEKQLQHHFELVQALSDHREQDALEIITNHLSSFYGLNNRYPDGFFSDGVTIDPEEKAISWETNENGENVINDKLVI